MASSSSATLIPQYHQLTTCATESNIPSGRPPVSPKSSHRNLNGNSSASSLSSFMNESLQQNSKASNSFADEYELRLRERMRWKEQFLYNNNNIDFANIVKREVLKSNGSSNDATDGSKSDVSKSLLSPSSQSKTITSPTTPTSEKSKINERIEFENASKSFELFDDDELTKMLNLDSQNTNQSGEEDEEEESTESGSSWKRSEDSTDADFDSDEFDASERNNTRTTTTSMAMTPSPRKNSNLDTPVIVPDIVVVESMDETVEDEEDVTNTSQQIDTGILENSSTADVVSEDTFHVTPVVGISGEITDVPDMKSQSCHEKNSGQVLSTASSSTVSTSFRASTTLCLEKQNHDKEEQEKEEGSSRVHLLNSLNSEIQEQHSKRSGLHLVLDTNKVKDGEEEDQEECEEEEDNNVVPVSLSCLWSPQPTNKKSRKHFPLSVASVSATTSKDQEETSLPPSYSSSLFL